jgi:hypothetical protein
VKLYVTHVNEVAERVDFTFGNTDFIVVVSDGTKGLEARISPDGAAYDLPNWVLAKCKIQAKAIINGRRESLLKRRANLPKAPEQLSLPLGK